MTNAQDPMQGLNEEQKRALLRKLMARKKAAAATAPASLAQHRLWVLTEIDPAGAAYNLLNAYRLRGTLRVPALAAALGRIVERHEVLRTTFRSSPEGPQQLVGEGSSSLPAVDLEGLEGAVREREAHRLTSSLARKSYDLQKGPLFRWCLVCLAPKEYLLLLMMHHIVADNWSFGVMNRELHELYRGFVEGREPQLPELAWQYRQYADWERAQVEGEGLEDPLRYWVGHLRGLEATELPSDRARPPVQTFRGETLTFALPTGLLEDLEPLRRSAKATHHMFYLAAFQGLLAKILGKADISCGAPIANRRRGEAENLIGFFVNTLVLRANVRRDLTFLDLVEQVRGSCLAAYARPQVPFDRLVQALQVERDLSRNPLYQITFQYGLLPPLELDGLEVSPRYLLDYGVVRSDLEFYLVAEGGQFRGVMVYNRDLYDGATIQSLASQFGELLRSIASEPQSALPLLAISSPAQRHQLCVELNDTQAVFPRDRGVHEIFSVVAGRQPHRKALEFGQEVSTYEELEQKSNQVAHDLLRRGVRPEEPVGVCLERSADSIVALLGVLKAGGFYVPLDPSHPTERLDLILNEVGARWCFVPQGQRSPVSASCQALRLEELPWEELSGKPPERRGHALGLAYAIYTSGSTGRPKGVLVPHRAILRLVLNTVYSPLGSSDRVLHASNVAFDAATWEIFGALLNGGTLVGISKEMALSVDEYVAFLESRRITAAFLTTALFNRIVDQKPEAFARLEHLLFGGEAVDPQRVREVVAHGKPRSFLHVYGPTESTTYASFHPIGAVAADARTVPIGLPISNTTIYLGRLAEEATPLRWTGELLIGGCGLSRGYNGQPRLTAEKFVPDALSGLPGERLYRTGDRVARTPAGSIEFQGRVDHQIKLRGFRIELGEIEAVLTQAPGLRNAVAAVWEARPGDRRLIAYVEAAEGAEIDVSGLKQFLRQSLPDYMVPVSFQVMDAFPMTPGGKVHRKALPAPSMADGGADGARFVPPGSEVEKAIDAIWREVLLVKKIGLDDNFFDLGGNSLLLVQARQALQERLQRSFSMVELFQYPTIRGLADFVSQGASQESVEQGESRGEMRRVARQKVGSRRDRRLAARRGRDE